VTSKDNPYVVLMFDVTEMLLESASFSFKSTPYEFQYANYKSVNDVKIAHRITYLNNGKRDFEETVNEFEIIEPAAANRK